MCVVSRASVSYAYSYSNCSQELGNPRFGRFPNGAVGAKGTVAAKGTVETKGVISLELPILI